MSKHRGTRRIAAFVLWFLPALLSPSGGSPLPRFEAQAPIVADEAAVLLRGVTEAELAAARAAFPPGKEPDVGRPAPRPVTVAGRVFLDANANGEPDAAEPGLPGVVVTDGERVRETGRDGSFLLRFAMGDEAHCRFVVVTRPSGYRPTTGWFLRILPDETGTQHAAAFGFAPDPLSRRREFAFIAASDSQFSQPDEMIPTAKDYAQMTAAPGDPAFLVTAGDLTMNGTHGEFGMYAAIRSASRLPVYDGFGGHDGNCLDPRSTLNFELRIGPPYYSWDYGGVHFIQFVTETGYLGAEGQAHQEAWIQADLKAMPRNRPVVVVTHLPLPGEWFDQRSAEGVRILCQIAAHWHVVQAGSRGGVPVLIAAPARGGDSGAYSRAYRRVRVGPNGIRTEVRIAGQYRRLELVAPGADAASGRQPLVVLAYDSARAVREVTCRVTGPTGRPRVTKLVRRGDWSWHGTLAPGEPGEWRIELKATDETGAVWQSDRSLRVVPARPAMARPGAGFPSFLAGDPPRCLPAGPGAPLRPLWVTHTGSVHVTLASPVVSGGRVYVPVSNPNAGSPGAGLLCLDARTGKEVWRARSPRGDVRGPAAVHDGRAYVLTAEGWVGAYDARTGRSLWRRPLRPEYGAGSPLAQNQAPPLPTPHGLLVTDWQKPQHLLDYATGKSLARLDGDAGQYNSFPTLFDDVMYCVRRGGNLALRVPTGTAVWQAPETARATSAGIVAFGKLFYIAASALCCADPATGNVEWQAAVPQVGQLRSVPVVWGDLVLVNGAGLSAIDRSTGRLRWRVPCGSDPERFRQSQRDVLAGVATPVAAGELVYFGHDDTSLRAVDRAGEVVWEYRPGTPIKASPVVSGNLLFVHDFAGNLWCFGPTG
ncbi:MAG: PQQ-binding-like beta-propeller repeat protein [Armatimonadetes bacterium]|nr:PQQ-binding-like beta-propeller repeat protein [Armatimonadota bacterium]